MSDKLKLVGVDDNADYEEVEPYVLDGGDGNLYIDFVRPVMIVPKEQLKKEHHKYLNRCVEVAGMRTARLILDCIDSPKIAGKIEIRNRSDGKVKIQTP